MDKPATNQPPDPDKRSQLYTQAQHEYTLANGLQWRPPAPNRQAQYYDKNPLPITILRCPLLSILSAFSVWDLLLDIHGDDAAANAHGYSELDDPTDDPPNIGAPIPASSNSEGPDIPELPHPLQTPSPNEKTPPLTNKTPPPNNKTPPPTNKPSPVNAVQAFPAEKSLRKPVTGPHHHRPPSESGAPPRQHDRVEEKKEDPAATGMLFLMQESQDANTLRMAEDCKREEANRLQNEEIQNKERRELEVRLARKDNAHKEALREDCCEREEAARQVRLDREQAALQMRLDREAADLRAREAED
ncbi:hypothetical protein VP01_772g7 [Puccinia sorghi]|uniref:Uncharacterized protein n=1 Tax=Puccinia sorghi TaxID=27349 RepID=A0A0L6UDL5_9BASI|nr:hypothetical protein VP01_772g7 [Puccinia sorghi]